MYICNEHRSVEYERRFISLFYSNSLKLKMHTTINFPIYQDYHSK